VPGPHADASRTDTLVVAGLPGAGKTTLWRGWLSERPAGERWAVLISGSGVLPVDPGTHEADAATVAVVGAGGGCACCTAQLTFSTALTRLLRRGPWHRLLIETAGHGHPARMIDRLRVPALADRLRLQPPVAVIDARSLPDLADPGAPLPSSLTDLLALARAVVLNRVDALAHGPASSLTERLASAAPWPRPVLPTASGRVPIARVLAALREADPIGAACARADRAVPIYRQAVGASTMRHGWYWSPAVTFDRSRLQAVLRDAVALGGVLHGPGSSRGAGAFRTERDGHAWRWADGCADWQESAWRADNRLEWVAAYPIDPCAVDLALRAAIAAG